MMALVCWVVAGFLLFFALIVIGVQRDKRQKEEDNQQKIKYILSHSYFGDLICEWDKKENVLLCSQINKSFGIYTPKLCIENYTEKNNDVYLEMLKRVYEQQEEVIHSLLTGFEGILNHYADLDEQVKEKIKGRLQIKEIYIDQREEFVIEEKDRVDQYVDTIKLSDDFFPYDNSGQVISPDTLILEVTLGFEQEDIPESLRASVGPVSMYMDGETKRMCYIVSM